MVHEAMLERHMARFMMDIYYGTGVGAPLGIIDASDLSTSPMSQPVESKGEGPLDP